MFKGHHARGTVEGTGAAITIQLGFTPEYVRIFNEDGLCELVWFGAMTAGHGFKRVTAGTMSKITSNGITPYEGTPGANAAGFTIGADADINVDAETLHYIAYSSDA